MATFQFKYSLFYTLHLLNEQQNGKDRGGGATAFNAIIDDPRKDAAFAATSQHFVSTFDVNCHEISLIIFCFPLYVIHFPRQFVDHTSHWDKFGPSDLTPGREIF